jgi:anti-sigma regulatory factor (Ser/Thr protein kinase)
MPQGFSPSATTATSLPAVLSSPRLARAFVRETVADWHLSADQSDDVLLVVDELVTNAVVHGGGPIGLSLDLIDQTVRIEVADSSSQMPAQRQASTTRDGGRGIALVAAIAAAWGALPNGSGGKSVWAEIPVAR